MVIVHNLGGVFEFLMPFLMTVKQHRAAAAEAEQQRQQQQLAAAQSCMIEQCMSIITDMRN